MMARLSVKKRNELIRSLAIGICLSLVNDQPSYARVNSVELRYSKLFGGVMLDKRSAQAKRAISLAVQLTGFDYAPPSSIDVDSLGSASVQRPFLKVAHDGSPFEVIRFTNVALRLKVRDQERDTMKRIFTVIVDAENAGLIEISSRSTNKTSGALPEPPAREIEHDLAADGETWQPLSDPPAKNFLDALTIIHSEGFPDPMNAAEINAVCVQINNKNIKNRPAWIITLKGVGFPVMGAATDSVPLWQRNRIRVIVDAETGQILGGGTAPGQVHP